eukprot:1423842-Pyramimonas_sp.AAC.1
MLQDPARSCAKFRVSAPLASQDPARSGALADPHSHGPPSWVRSGMSSYRRTVDDTSKKAATTTTKLKQ